MNHQNQKPTGTLFIISAPSGTGKTSLVMALLKRLSHVKLSVSYTTRAIRPGEKDGIDYHFVSDDQFRDMLNKNEFLEHAEVFKRHYGTAKHTVETALSDGFDVILEIDWQGAKQIRKMFPKTASIFIFPPSIEALRARILERKQNTKEDAEYRINSAFSEASHYAEYDYLIVNDEFEKAVSDLEIIFCAERFRTKHQKYYLRDLLKTFYL